VPRIGNVEVSDDVVSSLSRAAEARAAAEAPRPGFLDVLGAAAQNTYGQLRYGLPYQAAKLTGTLTPEAEQRYQQGLAEADAVGNAAAPASVSDLTSGRVGFGRFIGENLAASLPYMAGSVVGGALGYARGGATGAVIGAVAGGTPQFSAQNVDRAVQEQGSLTNAAAARALAVAPFQSASDAAIARFLPGAGKVLGDLAAHQSGGFLRRTAMSMLEAAGTEAVTEAAQQVGERYAAGLKLNDADAAGEYVNAAVTAFALGGVLGAGGGFRRHISDAKPADMVTVDDMNAKVDGILDGSLRALPSPQSFGREPGGPEVSASEPIVQGPGVQNAPPDFIVDAEGRAVPPGPEGERALAIDQNQPQVLQNTFIGNVTPEVQAALDQATPPVNVPLTGSTALSRGLQGTHLEPPEPFTPLSSEQVVPPMAVPGAPRVNPVTGAEIPFDTFLAEQKKGLRGGFVQQVQATDEMDLLGKVYNQVFVEQDSRANTAKFAQRLGLLDENLQPTELAQYVETARNAAAVEEQAPGTGTSTPAPLSPVTRETAGADDSAGTAVETPGSPRMTPQVTNDPTFEAQWNQIKQDAGIKRTRGGQGVLDRTPANIEQARAQIFRALANDTSNAEVSQVEKVARKMGLVTDDDAMDVTPLGRQAFLSTPEGLQETVLAAQQQGYTGARASIFDRGVQAQIAGEAVAPPTFSDFGDMAAYQAGQVWAQDFVENAETRTAAQTEAIRARQEGRTTGTAVPREQTRLELAPQQVQQQAMNRLIDAADLRGINDTDVATLRQMVRNGANPDEVGQALQRVQSGRTLFEQPATTQTEMAPARPARRAQPLFKEMNTQVASAKTVQRAETDTAVRAFEMRSLINFALAEKGITKARADRLHQLLDEGKVDQVASSMKNFLAEARTSGDVDPQFEQFVSGKDFMGALNHMVDHAPSAYHREIMSRVRELAQGLQKQGYDLQFKVIKPGDAVPAAMQDGLTRAFVTMRREPPGATVYLQSADMGDHAGMNYQIAAHEMIHAVTMGLLQHGNTPGVYGNTKLGRAVRDLYDLQHAIADHFIARREAGNLSPFERAFLHGDNNALDNVDEILAWGLTNPDMQRYLASIEYKPKQSVFSRLVELLRNVLGLDAKYDTALTELLRVSEQITGTGQGELRSMYQMNWPEGFKEAALVAPLNDAAVSAQNRTAEASNETTQRFAQAAETFVNNLNLRDKAAKTRRVMLGWLSHNQIDRQYGDQIPATIEHSDAHRERVAIRSRFEQMGEDAYQRFEQLERANPKTAERVGQLMATTTEFQIDPDKTWEQHTWLHDDANAANLKRLHGDAVKLANDLKRGDGAGWASYQDFRHLNEAQNFARMAVGLHGLVATDPELAMGIENSWANPADQFMRAEGLSSPSSIRDHWSQALDAQVAAATAFVRQKKGEAAAGSASDQRAMNQHLSPIEMQVDAIHEAKAAMAKAPYFHRGRFGDNFGSAVIRKGEDGNVDPAAQRKVAEALEAAGFTDAQISADSTKPRFMLRFDTVDQAMRFRQVALQLQRQGLLSDDEIKVGPRNRTDNYGTADGLPQFVASYISNLEASPMFAADESMSPDDRAALEKLKQDTINLARDTWIESQPDSSISKVLSKRYTVPGYNKDMIRNFAHRWRVGSINIANVASAPKFNRAFTNMRAQYNEALVANRKGPNGEQLSPADPFTVQDVMAELKLRDAKNPVNETADTFDKLRGYAHSYFLGFSPAYGLINMTQLGVVTLPELAKKYGYRNSFHAMRRASTQALAIVKAVSSEAGKLGWRHWGDVAITEDVLKKAGLDDKTRNFLQHMLATGTIDIGSMARSLGQVADNKGVGGATETYLKLSSAIGLYTETFSRLVTALSARELHGGYDKAAQDYATSTVSNSMFDYQNWNTARQLGKKGFLGPVTPLLTQFMSYQVQITEKLYSEALDAFQRARPGESEAQAKQRRTEARRFIGGHLAAVTALAGTLGLPFATVFATALERMVDALDDDDEPFDATSAYRNFLASVFGKDVAEVLARGAPRVAGFDISARAGEQNLLPFSEFLADRRSWKEAVANSAGRSLGAVPSMLQNVLDGGGQIADGDYLGGAKTMLPVAFKSPLEAYRMTNEGYIDTKGNKLPLSPTAASYLWQLLGFSPSAKAEYGEARSDQAARRGEITRRASSLRQQIVRALRTGDNAGARDLIAEAMKFDQDNPGFAVIPSISASFERQSRNAAQSRALTTPTGVSLKDVAGQQMTSYANF